MLKEPCPYHQGPVKHTLEECVMLRRYFHKTGPPAEDGKGHDNDKKEGGKEEGFPEVHNCFMIYGGQEANASAWHRKQERREVCLVKVAAPVYLDWSDKPITFNQGNHPDFVPSPGRYPLFISPLGKHLRYVIRLHFPASNNVAEYEALVNGLHITIELGVRRLDARGDAQLVIDQVMKNSHCRDRGMEAYCDEVRRLENKFHGLELNHIARRYNETTDELAKIASGRTTVPLDVFSRDLHQPSVKIDDALEPEEASTQPEVPSAAPEARSAIEEEALPVEEEQNGVTPDPNWQTSYLEYLLQRELSIDKTKARRLARRAKSFVLLGDEKELYHRSPSGILQRCISIAQGQELLQEIHSGACGHHAAPRALVGNAFRQGFY
jgi:ribonuclease HI